MTFSGLSVDIAKRIGLANASSPKVATTEIASSEEKQGDYLESRLVAALESPRGFPPLIQALVPDDHITIALQGPMSSLRPVAMELIGFLVEHGFRADQVTLLIEFDAQSAVALIQRQLQQADLDGVAVVVHDPTDEQEAAYLAAAEDASPIIFSRYLLDADFVIPVFDASRLLQEEAAELFPAFSDRASQLRIQEHLRHGSLNSAIRLADEARTHLGVLFEVAVIAQPNGDIAEVVAGLREEVRPYVEQAMKSAQGHEIDRPVDLVVASPRGEDEPYTWRDFLRTVRQLAPLVAVDGTLAVVAPFHWDASAPSDWNEVYESKLDWEHPSETNAPREENDHASEARTSDDTPFDLDDALDLMRIVVHGPGCEEAVDLFETKGVGVASSLTAVQRLIDQADQCLVVNDALQTRVRVRQNQDSIE